MNTKQKKIRLKQLRLNSLMHVTWVVRMRPHVRPKSKLFPYQEEFAAALKSAAGDLLENHKQIHKKTAEWFERVKSGETKPVMEFADGSKMCKTPGVDGVQFLISVKRPRIKKLSKEDRKAMATLRYKAYARAVAEAMSTNTAPIKNDHKGIVLS